MWQRSKETKKKKKQTNFCSTTLKASDATVYVSSTFKLLIDRVQYLNLALLVNLASMQKRKKKKIHIPLFYSFIIISQYLGGWNSLSLSSLSRKFQQSSTMISLVVSFQSLIESRAGGLQPHGQLGHPLP